MHARHLTQARAMTIAVRPAFALALLAAGAALLRTGMEAQALSDILAHAPHCLLGAPAVAGDSTPTFLGHCALCWGGAAAIVAGAAGMIPWRGKA